MNHAPERRCSRCVCTRVSKQRISHAATVANCLRKLKARALLAPTRGNWSAVTPPKSKSTQRSAVAFPDFPRRAARTPEPRLSHGSAG